MSDSLLAELTKIKTKLDVLKERVDNLADLIEKDHDILIETTQKLKEIDNWRNKMDSLNCKARLDAIEQWIKNHEKAHSSSFDFKFAIFLILLSSFFSALFTYIFAKL